MRQLLPHIKIGMDEDTRAVLVIDDMELSDFIEDYLTEVCDIKIESLRVSEMAGREVVSMYFQTAVCVEALEDAIRSVSAEKVEEIYSINNPPN